MASMRDSMVRNLKHFVDYDLMGVLRWDKAKIKIISDDEIEISFAVPVPHVVRIESPDFSPSNPRGCVVLDQQPIGPIDEATWDKLALRIKAERARHEIEAGNGRQPDGATL